MADLFFVYIFFQDYKKESRKDRKIKKRHAELMDEMEARNDIKKPCLDDFERLIQTVKCKVDYEDDGDDE